MPEHIFKIASRKTVVKLYHKFVRQLRIFVQNNRFPQKGRKITAEKEASAVENRRSHGMQSLIHISLQTPAERSQPSVLQRDLFAEVAGGHHLEAQKIPVKGLDIGIADLHGDIGHGLVRGEQ